MSEAEDASILGSNLTAVEAISAKLAEVTRLAEKLDARLCEAGARTRPIAVTSSTSTLLSMSATSSGTPIRPISSVPIALTPIMTTSSASATAQIRSTSTESAPTVVKFDLAKSDIAKKFDEPSPRIPSRSPESVEALRTDSSKEAPLKKVNQRSSIERFKI